MRTIASVILFVGAVVLFLGAFNVIKLDNFDANTAGFGFTLLAFSISLFFKVWVDKSK